MKKDKLFVESLGLYLHKKLEIHLLITVVFNIISILVIIGLYELVGFSLIEYKNDVIGLIIYSLINTVIIEVLKLFVVRHLMDLIVKTKGLIFILINGLVFWITSEIFVEQLYFKKTKIVTILVFTISFILMKLLLVIALQRVNKEDDDHEKLDQKKPS